MAEDEKQSKGVVCENCSGCIFRFVAVTAGRCPFCRAQLQRDQKKCTLLG